MLNLYGRMVLEYVKTYRPREYLRLQAEQKVMSFCMQQAEQIEEQIDATLASLKQRPGPESFQERVAWESQLLQRATELVLADVLPMEEPALLEEQLEEPAA